MKFKICPKCQNQCKPALSVCPVCRRSIISVPVTDDEVAIQVSQPVKEETTGTVRVCEECRTKNKPNARICENCGEDISDVEPTTASALAPQSVANATNDYLASIDGKYRFVIKNAVHILGRNNEFGDYLASKPFVSGTHAKITKNGGLIYITDMGSTNGTFINNTRVNAQVPVLLNDNDEIGFGGNSNNYQDKAAYFRITKAKN